MIQYLYFNKKKKILSMISDKSLKYDKEIFDEKKLTLTKSKVEEVKNGIMTQWKDKKLIITPRQKDKNEELQKVKKCIDKEGVTKENIKQLIDNLI